MLICFIDYFLILEFEFFCQGIFDFVCVKVLFLVNDFGSIVFDDEESVDYVGIEFLWYIVLIVLFNSIVVKYVICIFVWDVYIESKFILIFFYYCVRKVYLGFVWWCLWQLLGVVLRFKLFVESSIVSDDVDVMDVVFLYQEVQE